MTYLNAFTLVEVLIVIGLASILSGIGLYIGAGSFTHTLSEQDAELVRSALERARGEAEAGICYTQNCTAGASHGVYLLQSGRRTATAVTIFEGASYASRDAAENTQILLSGTQYASGDSETTFSPVAATATPASFVLTSSTKKSVHITISAAGVLSAQ